ncbi:MAG: hypothetical protein KAX80_00015 [Planctomycetes bacterium]|nr:hypothetical protein [Planctomycetota bacterium]
MAVYTRTSRQEFPSTDPARRGAVDVAYVYVDERFQTFLIKLSLEEDTPERVQELLRDAVARSEAAGPKQIEL